MPNYTREGVLRCRIRSSYSEMPKMWVLLDVSEMREVARYCAVAPFWVNLVPPVPDSFACFVIYFFKPTTVILNRFTLKWKTAITILYTVPSAHMMNVIVVH